MTHDGLTLAGCKMLTQPLSQSPFSIGQGTKMRGKNVRGSRQGDHLPVTVMGKTD